MKKSRHCPIHKIERCSYKNKKQSHIETRIIGKYACYNTRELVKKGYCVWDVLFTIHNLDFFKTRRQEYMIVVLLSSGLNFYNKLFASATRFELFEEVVTFVVNEDKCWEVNYFDFPDCFHAEFWILNAFDALNVVLSKNSSWTTD